MKEKKLEEKHQLKSKFDALNVNFVTIHWDSKIFQDITRKKSADRLPGPNIEQFLVPELSSGTGNKMASAL